MRVACSLLKTRAVDCDATTTVGELKSRVDIAIRKGEHEWYTTEGVKEAVRYVVGALGATPERETAPLEAPFF